MAPPWRSPSSQIGGWHSYSPRSEVTMMNLQQQWQSPSDILSVLLILGPDVIQRALAQLAGSRLTPAVFSFGWVAYAVSAILSAVGGA